MKKSIARLLLVVGGLFAGAASVGCVVGFLDETKMPSNMIER